MILVTGATGFVGQALTEQLGGNVVASVRKRPSATLPGIPHQIEIGNILPTTDWSEALHKVDVVVHLAARVHIMNEALDDPLYEFRKLNTRAALNLAKQAATAGIKRFIFISSVKVNGEVTKLEKPFKPSDKFRPNDPYGLSKYEAEQQLLLLAKKTGMEVVIIRPPLVYGPGVRANFSALMKWTNTRLPLPFGAINNKRSLVALDNLVNFIIHCIDHPKAANEIFLISDGEDVSTTELLQKVAKAFGKTSLLIPIPVSLMSLAARFIGKGDVANRLFGSLQVDSSKARDLLGWKPVITMDEQLKKTADAYLKNEKNL